GGSSPPCVSTRNDLPSCIGEHVEWIRMRPIVYLHGFASSPSSSKARFFHDLLVRAGTTVSIPDLADGDFERLTITRQLAVLDRTVAGRSVDLVGSSMGGW